MERPANQETLEYLGRYTLRQSDLCFKLGRDSVMLAGFVTLKRGWKVCDLGCGVGSLLVLLSQREESLDRLGVEIDPRAAALARRNLAENSLSGTILEGDLRQRELLPADAFQLVVTNPPYFQVGTGFSGGRARMEETCSVEEICAAAGRLLRSGGRFGVVFRPERLPQLFSAMETAKLAPKRLQLLCYNRQKPPFAVLVEGVKEGGAGLTVLPVHYQEE